MHVDRGRLREDLLANATFGGVESEGHGRTVLTGTEADRAAREQLLAQFEALGMDGRVDRVGNVVGRWVPETADPDAKPVATGSHLDSVPHGGIFDGPLGVYGGLEAVRVLRESGRELARPIEVVSFTEEEGTRFGVGLLGSSVAAGTLPVEEALALEDETGTTLKQRLEAIGFLGEGILDPGDWEGWLELHIEQSTELESAAKQAGIVTAITGVAHYSVEFVGEANHAGATRMGARADALAAAATFISDIERAGHELVAGGEEFAVATVGHAAVEPNATNVVAGRVELGLDIRDVSPAVMDELLERARESLARIETERGVETSLVEDQRTEPTEMSTRIREALASSCQRHGITSTTLPSGGGHDTMNVARHTDAGLLFAPSRDGISHSPAEWTDWEDCAACTLVLAEALAALAE